MLQHGDKLQEIPLHLKVKFLQYGGPNSSLKNLEHFFLIQTHLSIRKLLKFLWFSVDATTITYEPIKQIFEIKFSRTMNLLCL